MNTITVIGSINLDRTIRVEKMPKPGETIHTKEIFSVGGGKGANQAVAAIRSQAKTHFIGAVGSDEAGTMMKELLIEEGINTNAIRTLADYPTGQAYIIVDDAGENSIMIVSGANNQIAVDFVEEQKETIEASDFLIAQFENNIDSTIAAFTIAKKAGVKTILNPAPALKNIPGKLIKVTDMIVPNETEVETLTGIKITNEMSMKAAANYLHSLGVKAVIITIGDKGAFYDIADKQGIIPAVPANVVDTTAAGDTFIGAMASVLDKDFNNIEEAIKYANKASSITVQRFGAQSSIPMINEIKEK